MSCVPALELLKLYCIEAFCNLIENKRNTIVFFVFLTLSFTGIITVDSLIFSVSQKAESELKISGDNTVTVKFPSHLSIDFLSSLFEKSQFEIMFFKKAFLVVSDTPFSDNVETVMGVNSEQIKKWKIETDGVFTGNAVIVSSEQLIDTQKKLYINSIPFNVIGVRKKKITHFLDSLGLKSTDIHAKYFIPLETLNRLTLKHTADSIELTTKRKILVSDLEEIKELLSSHEIMDYVITSYLDAKETVRNVMVRFSLVTNFVYIILTSISLIVVSTICRRNFQLRGTEFALKIIHGIGGNSLICIVILETLIVNLLCLITSLKLCLILFTFLMPLLNSEFHLRFDMIGCALFIVTATCCITSILTGRRFLNKDPIDIVKHRMI